MSAPTTASSTLAPSRVAWLSWLPTVGICALAAVLRFYRIDAQSLWYDEGISAFQLTRSFPEIARAAAMDTHPPLYYWLLKAWGAVFGNSEIGLRSLSAVAGVAAVALTWLLGRDLFGRATAAVAALLLACSPLAVYYGQEVRMYTLVTAAGLLVAWAYARDRYALYAPAAAATLYSQYLGAALLVAVHVHALAWWRARCRGGWARWLVANLVAAALFLPWLPAFLAQSGGRALNTSPRTVAGLLQATLSAYGGGLAQGDLSLTGGSVLVGLALLGVGLAWRRRARSVSFALLLWVAPLALVLGLGLRSGLFESRYLVLGLPGLCLLAATGVVQAARLITRQVAAAGAVAVLLVAATLAPAAAALDRQYFDPSLARDDYRGLVRDIERQAAPGDAIVLSAPNQAEVFSFYYRGPLPIYPLPAQRPPDRRDLEQRLEAIRATHSRVWLVAWALGEADPRGWLETWLARNGFQASHQWYGTVQLASIAFAQADQAVAVDLGLDNGVRLQGYRLSGWTAAPGDTVALTLVWQAQTPPSGRWKVFTHLLDDRQQVVAQRDAEPDGGLRPTTSWQPGETVEDRYGLAIPAGLRSGSYTLEVGMYQENGRRAVFEGVGDHLTLGSVQVQAP